MMGGSGASEWLGGIWGLAKGVGLFCALGAWRFRQAARLRVAARCPLVSLFCASHTPATHQPTRTTGTVRSSSRAPRARVLTTNAASQDVPPRRSSSGRRAPVPCCRRSTRYGVWVSSWWAVQRWGWDAARTPV